MMQCHLLLDIAAPQYLYRLYCFTIAILPQSERVEQLEALAGSRKLAVDKLEAILRSQQEEQENKESVETQMAVLEVQKQLAEARRHNTVLATKYDAECKKSAGLSEELQALKQQYDESTMEVPLVLLAASAVVAVLNSSGSPCADR